MTGKHRLLVMILCLGMAGAFLVNRIFQLSSSGRIPPSPLSEETGANPLIRGEYVVPPDKGGRGVSSVTTTNALVLRVVDGDTIEVLSYGVSTTAKIRLLGVNTPESVDPRRPIECFGKEASRFLQGLVEGKRVHLEEDAQADDRDKYGRLLRNVFLDDGTDINALIVEQGFAHAYLSYPLDKQRKNELARLQEEAKTAKRGLWNPETCDGMK